MQRHSSVPFWRDVRVLTIFSQVLFVLVLAVVAGFLYMNVTTALRQRGMSVSLDFLNLESGFEIGEGLIPYRPSDTYGRAFLLGILNTLLVSGVGIVLATVLGVVVGVARLSSNWLVNRLASAYIEIIRNTPLLVQLVFVYFGVFVKLPTVQEAIQLPGSIFASQRGVVIPRPIPSSTFLIWLAFVVVGAAVGLALWRVLSGRTQGIALPALASAVGFVVVAGVGWVVVGSSPVSMDLPVRGKFNFTGGIALSPEFSALLSGLVIYTAAFIAEVVRGGIQSVRPGQIEAARALGLGDMQILQLVIFPQALRVIVPPLTSQYLNLAKNSSLAIAIGFPDLFQVSATMMNQTGRPIPVIALVMATYLVMSLFTSLLMNLYNRRVQILEK